jgi:hypothetical protein
VIHNQVVLGISPSPEGKTREERLLESRARAALAEWRLVREGAATYETLGYGVPDQGPAAVKLLEFLAISTEMDGALEEKRRKLYGHH